MKGASDAASVITSSSPDAKVKVDALESEDQEAYLMSDDVVGNSATSTSNPDDGGPVSDDAVDTDAAEMADLLKRKRAADDDEQEDGNLLSAARKRRDSISNKTPSLKFASASVSEATTNGSPPSASSDVS